METFPSDLKVMTQYELNRVIFNANIHKFQKILAMYYYAQHDSENFGFRDLLDRLELDERVEIELAKKYYINNNWNVLGSVNLDHIDIN
jgi:hypothetical protein